MLQDRSIHGHNPIDQNVDDVFAPNELLSSKSLAFRTARLTQSGLKL